MAFTVEDGTVVEGANSYVTLAAANTYFVDRGSPTTWTGATDANKQAALIYATRWIDERYVWLGEVSTTTSVNRLRWPRILAMDHEDRTWDGIPQILKDAVCEVALAHLSEGVNEVRDRGGAIKRDKVDVLETEWFEGAPSGRSWPYVDSLLRPIGYPVAANWRLKRA